MSTKPRVLHLCSNRWNSAIAEYALSSVRCLASDTEQQAIVLRGSPLMLRLKPLVQTLELPSFSLSQVFAVTKSILRFKPDIIICYGGPELSLVAAVQTVIGATPTARFFGDASRIYKKPSVFSSFVINLMCNQLILPSPKLASTWSGFFPNLKVQPITIGLNEEKLQLRPDIVRCKRPTLLIFGRIDPIKGHYQAMTIFQELLKIWPAHTPRPLLRIVGRAANLSHQQLRDHARSIKLSDDDLDLVDTHINDITTSCT